MLEGKRRKFRKNCFKMLLWSLVAIFLVLGVFKDGVTNFTDAIVLMLLGTILLIESIEYKNNIKKDYHFYFTFIYGLIAYFLAAYILFHVVFNLLNL